jgi:hypothetical protein
LSVVQRLSRDVQPAVEVVHFEHLIATGHAHRTVGAKCGAPTVEDMAAALEKFPLYEIA